VDFVPSTVIDALPDPVRMAFDTVRVPCSESVLESAILYGPLNPPLALIARVAVNAPPPTPLDSVAVPVITRLVLMVAVPFICKVVVTVAAFAAAAAARRVMEMV
jgi:hypothetical protein